jgi:hypothetical protein
VSTHEHIRLSQALYFQNLDDRGVEGLVAVFDENARVVFEGGEIVGSSAIKKWIEDYFGNLPPGLLTKHICSNMVISISGETAESRSDVAVFQWDASGGWRMLAVTRHHDRFGPQANGSWLITEKRIASIGEPNR